MLSMNQTPATATPAPTSALYSLVALKLDADPRQWILDKRDAGASWRTIREDLRAATDVTVNHQTLINWSGTAPTA